MKEEILNRLVCDILPSRVDEEMLLAIRDTSILCASNATTSPVWKQPFLSMNFLGRLLIIVVSEHNVSTFGQNFPVVPDLDGNAVDGLAHGSKLIIVEANRAGDWRSLGQSISFYLY